MAVGVNAKVAFHSFSRVSALRSAWHKGGFDGFAAGNTSRLYGSGISEI
jgi:hypothetical protein